MMSDNKSDSTTEYEIHEDDLKTPIPPFKLESLSQLKAEANNQFKLAKRKIQIYTKSLDPRVLSNRDVEQSLTCFIRSSRNARAEILIEEERSMQGVDHRLVNLAQRYSTYVSIRIIPKDFHENPFAFYLIDGRHMIYRRLAERYECEIHQLPSSKLKQMSKYFDDVWEQSAPAIHLRALHL